MATSAGVPEMPIAGVEVPIPGSDKLDWISLTVPSSSPPSSPFSDSVGSHDLAGCHVIEDNPLACIVWYALSSLYRHIQCFALVFPLPKQSQFILANLQEVPQKYAQCARTFRHFAHQGVPFQWITPCFQGCSLSLCISVQK